MLLLLLLLSPIETWAFDGVMDLGFSDPTRPGSWILEDELSKAGTAPLTLVSPTSLPNLIPDGFPDGSIVELRAALERQLVRCEALDPDLVWKFGTRNLTRSQWCQNTARAFLVLLDEVEDPVAFWEQAKIRFDWYSSQGSDGAGDVLYTGYYLPWLRGSRTETDQYTYPLYRRPHDLVRIRSGGRLVTRQRRADGSYGLYPDRKMIDWEGALAGQNLEIAFVDDPIEAFFLHIQGSGQVLIENEGLKPIFVNYAVTNGRAYTGIGTVLQREGVSREYLSLQGLRRYFRERPAEIDRIFPMNQSYIFFQEATSGPYGSGATLLAPGHSIATDNTIYPLGAVALIQARRPIDESPGAIWQPFSRIVVNQDTGGAIRGPGRVDVYWGSGEYAEAAAGGMYQHGKLYFAVVKED